MIGIVDYGMGNLRSVQKALERAGAVDARLVRTPQELAQAQKVVLPGVAAFGDAMIELKEMRLAEPLCKAVADGTPFLGFCLGLQVLFEVGYEDGEHKGLGILPGKVVRFKFGPELASQRLRIPHMGWNQIESKGACPMLRGIDNGSHVYFCHSYYPVVDDASLVATTTQYGYSFASSVWRGNVFATQFHPEKSQEIGLRLLRNFVDL